MLADLISNVVSNIHMYLALGIFLIAFSLIVFEVFDKSLIALGGALLMIITGVIDPEHAIHAIDEETILLLLSMMILVGIASKSGVFEWLSVKIAAFTRGNPYAIFIFFSLVTAVLSAFLDNVTTIILIVPLTMELVKGMGKDPKPYIFAEIIFSNIGGALTLIGDPPNMIIAGAGGLSFLDFIVNLWIPITGSLVLATIIFTAVYWKKLKPISDNLIELCIAHITIEKIKLTFANRTLNKIFIFKVLAALFLTILGFFLQAKIGLPNYIIALTAAIVLGIITEKQISIHDSFKNVEWTTLFFFSGLFIMVAGVEETGLLEKLSHFVANSTDNLLYLTLIVLWVSGFVSMILDNIPFVTVMTSVIIGIQVQLKAKYGTELDTQVLWWALSLGACLGGNGTLIGASANVVAVDIAKKNGTRISFMEYTKFALPLTVGVLLLCSTFFFIKLG